MARQRGAHMDAGLKRELEAKVYAGVRLTRADGEALYASDDLAWLGRLAHHKRTELNGDRVMFNVNRHLNLTNVCSASCAYCSFQRKPGERDAYTMRIDEAVRKAKEMEDEQLTELHIVNGHLNMTNVCSASCAYCPFQRKPGEKDARTLN